MTHHHPPIELLLDYAAGSVCEAVDLAVACHLCACGSCRRDVEDNVAIGGILLDTLEPRPVDSALLNVCLSRLDEPYAATVSSTAVVNNGISSRIPAPLRQYLGQGPDHLPWRKVGRLFEEFRLPLSSGGFTATLMRLRAGSVMPVHDHRSPEYTLVLAGGYKDQGGQFLPGDFDAREIGHEHQPVVDGDEDCLCLVVLDAPVKLTGTFGRFLNPFLRI